MRSNSVIGGAIGLSCLAGPGLAHPHAFVDTAIEARFDAQGRVVALEITWIYDEFYSLLLLEDRQLDLDGDGQLTAEETAALQGFNMNWTPGYAGDTHVTLAGQTLDLSGPSDWTAALVAGKLVSTHLRFLPEPVDPRQGPLMIQSYDPEYYVAYTITDATMAGAPADCAAVIWAVDVAAVDEMLNRAAQEYAGSEDAATAVPLIGAAYADEIRLSCPTS